MAKIIEVGNFYLIHDGSKKGQCFAKKDIGKELLGIHFHEDDFDKIEIVRKQKTSICWSIFYSTGLIKKLPYTCTNEVTDINAL